MVSITHYHSISKGHPYWYFKQYTKDIADHLKNRKAVVINLQRIGHDQAKRIVDFLSGTVYAIGGDIQKLGANIFLCTPDNVDVAGTISDILSE